VNPSGRRVCANRNECIRNEDCPEGLWCLPGLQWFVCEVPQDQCQGNADCNFHYRCNTAVTPHACVYASECRDDPDCGFGRICRQQDNWKVCKVGLDVCASDADCPPDMYCDGIVLGVGSCKSRDQCRTDADCASWQVCESNGIFFVCMDAEQCTRHQDCDYGFKCLYAQPHNRCVPASECSRDSDCGPNARCVAGTQWNVCRALEVPCSVDADCEFGYHCDTGTTPATCRYASTCRSDADCGANSTCEVVGHWKECRFDFNPSFCTTDRDCALSEYCDLGLLGFGTCKSRNECDQDWDCPRDFRCLSNGVYNVCLDATNCQQHADCPLGYRCEPAIPYNQCQYANECTKDADCAATEACVFDGNWTRCKLAWNGVCTSDANCDPDEWCDRALGPLGTCRSRNQCFVDADCGEGLVCQSNGTWNECVPETPRNCWFDFQCPDGWTCNNGQCRPVYAGTCTEVEGRWTVWYSPCVLVPMGTVYEFVPEDGCNGKVKLVATGTTNGTFRRTGEDAYDITLSLVYNCTARLSLADSVMTMDCPLGCTGIQMAR
jgi:hypothetical protein